MNKLSEPVYFKHFSRINPTFGKPKTKNIPFTLIFFFLVKRIYRVTGLTSVCRTAIGWCSGGSG